MSFMKKVLSFSILFFVLGFLTHALFFPDVLNNGITDIGALIVPNAKPTSTVTKHEAALTTISFDGQKFSRHNVTVGYTRYIQIVNTSKDKLMWLISTTDELATKRGYGTSELVTMQANKKGTFVVADKNNPQEKLVITVK